MGLEFQYIAGQTQIDLDEKKDLMIQTISSKKELDEFEQMNIEKAIEWTYKMKWNKEQVFTEHFIKLVHKKMFSDVWKWAGDFRKTNKNIGVDKFQISMKLKNLIDDCKYWIDNSIYDAEEICIRFKHKLVFIHLFPNGNGRHSRLMADILIDKVFQKQIFTWGSNEINVEGDIRSLYLSGLREADKGNYKPLIQFSRL